MADNDRRYKMTVAGQFFRHLGLQMYSGAVPVISELISNAYDAMAKNVWVEIPIGRALRQTDKIVVKDDGHGMSFGECNSFYLNVGRDRRSGQGGWTKRYNGISPRKVQGRKGIGKLAGFGIADGIEIRSIKENEISHFELDYSELTKSSNFADTEGYEAELLSDDGIHTDDKPGTMITLSRLKIERAINEQQFRKSIARRLLVLDQNFMVHVNGEIILRQEISFQFRFPENAGKWETDTLANGRQIRWWAGFRKSPIREEEQRGFVVYVRGKLAQTPWFFDLSGGAWGQHGIQYLTGEVQADFLDESEDLIATDRGAVRWEDPAAAPLKEWGRKKVKGLLEKWIKKRREAKVKSPEVKLYIQQAEKLPKNERDIFNKVVNSICSIPQLDKDEKNRDIATDLVKFVYRALTNRSFLDAIRRLNAASPTDIDHFKEILSEWDIIEAVNTAHLVKGRVEIIQKFEQMIETGTREKPDMQDYLREHPWLIDPKWAMLVHERSLDKIICDHLGIPISKDKEGSRRPDFFCLGDSQTAYVVEVKRPGDIVGRNEFRQLEDYVHYLRKQLQESATNTEYKRTVVKGLLIADRIRSGDEGHAESGQKAGNFERRTWENLLTTAKTMHAEFLDAVTKRAPSDDPRIAELTDMKTENGSE